MKLIIVSGFLGSGKTTWLKTLLEKIEDPSKLCIIENDFGTTNLDAALLKTSGLSIRTLESGCVCCTISSDLQTTLSEIQKTIEPQAVLLEPSGVAKLSELLSSIKKASISDIYSITIVDGSRWFINLDNYGDYFEDQITHADFIVLNRHSEKDAKDILEEFPTVHMIDEQESISKALSFLNAEHDNKNQCTNELGHDCHCHHHHHHHHHDHHEDFRSEAITMPSRTKEEWTSLFEKNASKLNAHGWVRAKGFVTIDNKVYVLQWSGGALNLDPWNDAISKEQINMITWIGYQPDTQILTNLDRHSNE